MSDETPQQESVEQVEQPAGQEDQPKMFDEAYVKKLRDEAASYRVKLKEYEDAQKTEAQKQQEELESARAELAELRIAKTRAEVAAAKGVPANLLTGGTQEELEAAADALIEFKGEQAKTNLHVPGEGKLPKNTGQVTSDAEFADFLTRRNI